MSRFNIEARPSSATSPPSEDKSESASESDSVSSSHGRGQHSSSDLGCSVSLLVWVILLHADRQPICATNSAKVIDVLGALEAACANVPIAALQLIGVIEIERTKRQGRSLGPADCGRIAIGAGQEVVPAVGDRVHEKPLIRALPHHRNTPPALLTRATLDIKHYR